MHNYKELKAWHKAMDFVTAVYLLTRQFPKDELFGLTNQVRRAAVSIPLNIAEGAGCETDQEFARVLDMALRSTYECAVALQLSNRLNYASAESTGALVEQGEEIARMVTGLIKHYAPNREYLR